MLKRMRAGQIGAVIDIRDALDRLHADLDLLVPAMRTSLRVK
ncbi:hypothetical protein [Methylobacterium oryzisoli]